MPIAVMEGCLSPRLGIRFTQKLGELEIYRPDSRRFLSSVELEQQITAERSRADAERSRANAERSRANASEKRAMAAEQAVTLAQERAERLAAQLRLLGIDPEQL